MDLLLNDNEDFNNKKEQNGFIEYIINKEVLDKFSKDTIVLHPLPRVNEIDVDVDDDERAVYFKQAKYGMFVRMALIMKLLGIEESQNYLEEVAIQYHFTFNKEKNKRLYG